MVLGRDLYDPVPPLRSTNHAPQGGDFFPVEETRGRAVSHNHKVLDNLFGPVLLISPQILDLVSGKDQARFHHAALAVPAALVAVRVAQVDLHSRNVIADSAQYR